MNLEYAEAAQDDYPGDVKQLIQRHLAEDKAAPAVDPRLAADLGDAGDGAIRVGV